MMNDFSEEDLERLDNELEQLLSEATPVRARVAKNPSFVFSVRLSAKELDEFGEAARARGLTVSELIRSATKAAILGDLNLEKASAVGEVKQKARELTEAIDRLTA